MWKVLSPYKLAHALLHESWLLTANQKINYLALLVQMIAHCCLPRKLSGIPHSHSSKISCSKLKFLVYRYMHVTLALGLSYQVLSSFCQIITVTLLLKEVTSQDPLCQDAH